MSNDTVFDWKNDREKILRSRTVWKGKDSPDDFTAYEKNRLILQEYERYLKEVPFEYHHVKEPDGHHVHVPFNEEEITYFSSRYQTAIDEIQEAIREHEELHGDDMSDMSRGYLRKPLLPRAACVKCWKFLQEGWAELVSDGIRLHPASKRNFPGTGGVKCDICADGYCHHPEGTVGDYSMFDVDDATLEQNLLIAIDTK